MEYLKQVFGVIQVNVATNCSSAWPCRAATEQSPQSLGTTEYHHFPDLEMLGACGQEQPQLWRSSASWQTGLGLGTASGPLPVFSQGLDLAYILKAGLVAHLSSCAGLRCSGTLKSGVWFFGFLSRPRRSRRTVFSLLQNFVVVSLLVQWLKLFLSVLETQAGLTSEWPLWFWAEGCKCLIWEVQGCGTWVGRGTSLCASGLLLPRF